MGPGGLHGAAAGLLSRGSATTSCYVDAARWTAAVPVHVCKLESRCACCNSSHSYLRADKHRVR